MAKVLAETRIAGRAERKRLRESDKPYWRGIDQGVHLGYRKGKRGGVWLVRWYAGTYKQQKLGIADDELSEGTLDFDAAVRLARQVVETARRNEQATIEGPPITVGDAVESYSVMRDNRENERRGRSVRSDARGKLERYVTGRPARGNRKEIAAAQLATTALHELDEDALIAWRKQLPDSLKGTSKRRLVNDLKAALNEAYAAHRSRLPATFPGIVKHGLRDSSANHASREPVARDNQILSDDQVADLVAAAREIDAEQRWEGDLYRLVLVMAATGARFSQVVRLAVGDYQAVGPRLLMPVSHKGNGGKTGYTPIRIGQDVADALKPIAAGRPATARLLERWNSERASGGIVWQRTERGPWQTPSQLTRPWAAIKSRAGLHDAIPYALRHSSIVRAIRERVPPSLVAKMHDTSLSMIERHYGRYIADELDELAARAIVPLVRGDRERAAEPLDNAVGDRSLTV